MAVVLRDACPLCARFHRRAGAWVIGTVNLAGSRSGSIALARRRVNALLFCACRTRLHVRLMMRVVERPEVSSELADAPQPDDEPRTGRSCSSGCLGVVLGAVGVFCVAVGVGGDPCGADRDSVAGWFLLAGSLLMGGAAFAIVRRPTRRPWVAWAWAVGTTALVGVGGMLFAFGRWVDECSN
jgi:hypothetical protein